MNNLFLTSRLPYTVLLRVLHGHYSALLPRLHLRAFGRRFTWFESQLGDLKKLDERVVEFLTEQLYYQYPNSGVETESYYVLPMRRVKPYQKRILFRYNTTRWQAMEKQLKCSFQKEDLAVFGTRYFRVNGQVRKANFSAIFHPAEEGSEPIELVFQTGYQRLAEPLMPFLLSGEVQLDLRFPGGCFDFVRRPDVFNLIEPHV